MHVRQPKISALIAIRKTFMVVTQTVQNGRIEVVNMHRIAGDVIAVIVGLSMNNAPADGQT